MKLSKHFVVVTEKINILEIDSRENANSIRDYYAACLFSLKEHDA